VKEKKRLSLSFVDLAPKINLVEAHLNRCSLSGERNDSPLQYKEKLERFQGFPPK
jgi:hypothetical protein